MSNQKSVGQSGRATGSMACVAAALFNRTYIFHIYEQSKEALACQHTRPGSMACEVAAIVLT